MKNAKIWNICSLVVWLLLAAAEVLLGMTVLRLDMLPGKYLAIVFALLALLLVLIGCLMYTRIGKYQRTQSRVRHIMAYCFSALLIVLCLVGASALNRVNSTIDNVTEESDISAIVNIYVKADDAAAELADARDYTFGITEAYDWTNTRAAIELVSGTLNQRITTVTYASVFEMVDALYAGEVNALFLNGAFLDILSDLEGYTAFETDTRVLYECSITGDMLAALPTEETTAPTAPDGTDPTETTPVETRPQVNYGDEVFIMYLSGSDTRSHLLTTSRSDVNILAVVNTDTKQILLVNTPRDYYIANPAGGGAKDKLTHCGIYGVSCSMRALEKLYSTSIEYYAQINFTGFETLIDAIGGVTVYSSTSFTTLHGGYSIQAGNNTLNGAQALAYARERYALSGGDNDRGKNQMKVITAVIQKLCSGTTIISNYTQILNSLEGMFVTNFKQDKISELVKMQLEDMASWNILSYAVTGTGGSATTYSVPGVSLSVIYPHQSSVNKAADLIDRVLSGEILTSADLS